MATKTEERMPKGDSNAFWKEQDFQTSARLHLQHWIWDYQLGYVLHPKIELPKDSFSIADIGCSNGAWMLDVARHYPNAQIEGLDISSANFLHPDWAPANIRFSVWDAFGDVREEHVGKFDVVHIRTLSSAVRQSNVGALIDNAIKMAKPGGYIQWEEIDGYAVTATLPPNCLSDGKATTSFARFFRAMTQLQMQTELPSEWLHGLSTSLTSRDCTVLVQDEIKPRQELQRAWTDNFLTVWLGLVATIPETPVPLPKIEGLPETLSRAWYVETFTKAVEECGKGVWINAPQYVYVAMKNA